MNKVNMIGRLTADPEVRYGGADNSIAIARYTLAVDRRYKKEGEQSADFIRCVAFGKNGEFAEKYLHKGMKIAVSGRIQTGSYTNKDGQKVFTTEIVVEEHDFCESKGSASAPAQVSEHTADPDGFISIPDDLSDDGLPFN